MTAATGRGEFDLIERYFRDSVGRSDVRLGIGDDGAVVRAPANRGLVQVVDTIIEGVHFPRDAPVEAIGHRALAVNLSDLAAMGAEPAWALLSLTLAASDDAWLVAFARGFSALARIHDVGLIGGDTTRGALSVTVQASGFVDTPMPRNGARTEDRVWVSGELGGAAAGLRLGQDNPQDPDSLSLRNRLLYPTPRVALGRELAGIATAAIDISDGLLADAGHMARASGVGMALATDQLPVSEAAERVSGRTGALEAALRGGDDYELLFTAPAGSDDAVRAAARAAGVSVHAIGAVVAGDGIRLDGEPAAGGWDHFAGAER